MEQCPPPPNHRIGSDFDVLFDHGVAAKEAVTAHFGAAIDDTAGADVAVIPDDGVVLDEGFGVDDAVFTDGSAGIDEGIMQDDSAFTDGGVGRDIGPGRNDRRELVAQTLEVIVEFDACDGGFDLTDGDEGVFILVSETREVIVCSDDRVSENALTDLIWLIDDASNLPDSFLPDHINAGFAVTATADEENMLNRHRRCLLCFNLLVKPRRESPSHINHQSND